MSKTFVDRCSKKYLSKAETQLSVVLAPGGVMSSGEWVFDDMGVRHAVGSHSLRSMLPALYYRGDLAADLVRNLGFISLGTRQKHVVVRLRTEVVSSVALVALLYWLADNRPQRVIVESVSDGRPAELFLTGHLAIAHLVKVTQEKSLPLRLRDFTGSIDRLPRDSAFQGLLQVWAEGGRTDVNALIKFAVENLAQRYFVFKPTSGQSLFHEIGFGAQVPDPSWRAMALNTAVTRQPDTDYWAWVNQHHRMVLESQAPHLSDVEAEIYWPSVGWVKRDYTRFLLPCDRCNGEQFLFSANTTKRLTGDRRMAS